MRRRLLIVSAAGLLVSVVGGGVAPSIEEWWQNRGVDPGLLEMRKLQQLFGAEQYDRALAEAGKARDERRFVNYRLQILYLQWAIAHRLQKTEQSEAAKDEFFRSYRDHVLAADMHFADAMNLLANADYPAANDKLAMIQTKWPGATVTAKAKQIREKLAKFDQQTSKRSEDPGAPGTRSRQTVATTQHGL